MEFNRGSLEDIVLKTSIRINDTVESLCGCVFNHYERAKHLFKTVNKVDFGFAVAKNGGFYAITLGVNEDGSGRGVLTVVKQLAFQLTYSVALGRVYRSIPQKYTTRKSAYPRMLTLYAINIGVFTAFHYLSGTPKPGITMICAGAWALGMNAAITETQLYLNGRQDDLHKDQES
ncbi:hypothetical protein HN419_03215 [Candidatus Woesearchaeota archaeon]|jgi:hypothetical protein|nr:hypothetical protein [Candidatus Woesearchaeota archaeon]MBT3536993.1 hypothetical protein [Candidatus Woesearchaeota archaeon]MBT4697603.1 hypothetical protein [Candidatus Woesearchaeota archaeon]MBT4717717.1 hypothetical protein [Candidatus Woesearchaeota archaeon]MBT7106697.1 hypothetical protein [Candidatus Woesearchaeota archaeon]